MGSSSSVRFAQLVPLNALATASNRPDHRSIRHFRMPERCVMVLDVAVLAR